MSYLSRLSIVCAHTAQTQHGRYYSNDKVGGGSDVGFWEVGREEVEADVSRVGEVVRDEVAGFNGDCNIQGMTSVGSHLIE